MENTITPEMKNEAIEFAKALEKLQKEELKKIYYMIKGIELVNEMEGNKAVGMESSYYLSKKT